MKNKFSFTKMHGAGNDFIIIDKDAFPEFPQDASLLERLCKRRFGIGADGLITVASGQDADFIMKYYNADGRPGTLCGNGARCALEFAYRKGKTAGRDIRFTVDGELYRGKIIDDNFIEFQLRKADDYQNDLVVSLPFGIMKGAFLNTGSPHFVINIDDEVNSWALKRLTHKNLESYPVDSLGSAIRNAKTFAPGGTNVNFIQIREDTVHIRTYERGVEAETYACGTGSAAAAIIAARSYDVKVPVTLKTYGNDLLTVSFTDDGNSVTDLKLAGPAVKTYEGEFYLDTYK